MSFPKINPTQTKAWVKLKTHYNQVKDIHLCSMFDNDPNREINFSFTLDDFFIDFSKQRWTKETIALFVDLAEELKVKEAISLYFQENELNFTEKRGVLHTALRNKEEELRLKDQSIYQDVDEVKKKMQVFTSNVISGTTRGYTNKEFKNVVNIGIGGSDLGPKLVSNSLKQYQNHLTPYFISNIDGDHLYEILSKINPEETLFIIASKSFTTAETIRNAKSVKEWFLNKMPVEAIRNHFVAVSANIDKVEDFGIVKENIFPMWDWVGGRFSLWSAVGLSIAMCIGYEQFEELLRGASEADKHFFESDLDKNIPVLMAFLSLWYVNFFKADQEAVIPYSQYLEDFVPYLQQSFMESNGKNVDRNGEELSYYTCPTVFGGVGCNAQHAFMQLFHQGKHLIPTDFIGFCKSLKGNVRHHDILMANLFAQSEALAFGTYGKNVGNPFKVFKGNQPSTTILIDKLNPKSLGKLIALYEHKVFVQGILWNINSFDQFGVELGKELSREIIKQLNKSDEVDVASPLFNFYKKQSKL